jgi:hypothetical protein
MLDLVEVLTAQDGQFNDELQAYVTAYPINDGTQVVYEIEYVDQDNDFEVIETVTHTVFLTRD